MGKVIGQGSAAAGGGPEGIALLAEIMRASGAAPVIVAGGDVLDDDNSLGAASTALSVPFGSAVVARTADRAVDLVFRCPDVASPSGGVVYLGGYGGATSAILCSVRCATALRLYHPQWSTNVDLATFANIRNKWVYIHIEYDFSALLFTAYVRIDGGAETTATLAMAASSSAGAMPLHLGGNISNEAGVSGLRYGAFGLYNALPGADHRAAVAAALGW